ncbi:hypothetical protein Pmani_039810, partial [Petrolisthes manimaculis]
TFSVESFVTYRWKDWRLRWQLRQPGLNPCWNPEPANITQPLNFSQICNASYTAKISRCESQNTTHGTKIIQPLNILNEIWQPDAFFKNGIRSSIHKDWVTNEYLAFYDNDGHIGLFSRMSITLMCHFDFHDYPHDQQKCEMLIQSLSYKSDELQFVWCNHMAPPTSKLDQDIFSLPHFTLAEYKHEECNEEYPCVRAVFVLVRHPDFHILHTYVPTVLIVTLSWMSFWIAPDATPARVTLGVTSILTMATQYSQSTKNLPPVSYIKSLDIWMITCMVYVFAALLEFAIVYHVHYRRSQAELLSPTPQSNGPVNPVSQGLGGLAGPRIQRVLKAWREFWKGDTAIDEASRVLFPVTYFSFVVGSLVVCRGLMSTPTPSNSAPPHPQCPPPLRHASPRPPLLRLTPSMTSGLSSITLPQQARTIQVEVKIMMGEGREVWLVPSHVNQQLCTKVYLNPVPSDRFTSTNSRKLARLEMEHYLRRTEVGLVQSPMTVVVQASPTTTTTGTATTHTYGMGNTTTTPTLKQVSAIDLERLLKGDLMTMNLTLNDLLLPPSQPYYQYRGVVGESSSSSSSSGVYEGDNVVMLSNGATIHNHSNLRNIRQISTTTNTNTPSPPPANTTPTPPPANTTPPPATTANSSGGGGNVASKFVNYATNLAKKAAKTAEDAKETVKEGATKAVNATKEAVKDPRETVKDAKETVKDAATKAVNATKEAVNDARETVKDAKEKVKEAATEAVNSAQDTVNAKKAAIAEKTTSVKSK